MLKLFRSTICPYVREHPFKAFNFEVILSVRVDTHPFVIFQKITVIKLDEFRIQFLYINLLKFIILCKKFHVVYNWFIVPINRFYGHRELVRP